MLCLQDLSYNFIPTTSYKEPWSYGLFSSYVQIGPKFESQGPKTSFLLVYTCRPGSQLQLTDGLTSFIVSWLSQILQWVDDTIYIFQLTLLIIIFNRKGMVNDGQCWLSYMDKKGPRHGKYVSSHQQQSHCCLPITANSYTVTVITCRFFTH